MRDVLVGDAVERLRELPDGIVQCCVTSPPYWSLRDYGVSGQIGLEATPEEWCAKLVETFREVRRVLRDDGVLFVNLGDSYAQSGGQREPEPLAVLQERAERKGYDVGAAQAGLHPGRAEPRSTRR